MTTITMKAFALFCGLLLIFAVMMIGLGETLSPLLIAFGLAYLIFPIIRFLEQKNINRHVAVGMVFTLIVVVLISAILIVLPGLVADAQVFFQELPVNAMKAINKIEEWSAELGYPITINRQNVKAMVVENASIFSSNSLKALSALMKGAFTNLMGVLLALLNLFLIPLFFFYVINDYEKISAEIKAFIPRVMHGKMEQYAGMLNQVLSGYIRGQLMVAFILGILYATGLSLVGLKFGLLIGFATGLLSIIPYVGFTIGVIASLIVALSNFTGIEVVFGVMAVFLVVQTLESFWITPKLVGNKVGLSAFATILALIIGGNILGFIGMLVAIPVASVLKVIILDFRRELYT